MRLWNFGDKTECFRMFSEKLYNAHNGSDSPTTIKRIVYFNFYRFCNINIHIHRTYKLSKISLRQYSSSMIVQIKIHENIHIPESHIHTRTIRYQSPNQHRTLSLRNFQYFSKSLHPSLNRRQTF